MIDAATVSGLRVLKLVTDTSATAFAYSYCLNKHKGGEKNILIFSLGGGVFSVSVVAMEDGVFEVKATSGDSCLGGEDFDTRMVDYFGKYLSIFLNENTYILIYSVSKGIQTQVPQGYVC